MRYDLKEWLEWKGEEVLRGVGIKEGQTVLDFGCGSGNYTIPAAKIVGKEGVVYALDKKKSTLDELMRRAEMECLSNIRRIDTSGQVKTNLYNESVDVVLLYDIFWYFPLSDPKLTELLAEIHRITKLDALISVYPKHIDSEQLKYKIESCGFRLKEKYSGMLLHHNWLEKGEVHNFTRVAKKQFLSMES